MEKEMEMEKDMQVESNQLEEAKIMPEEMEEDMDDQEFDAREILDKEVDASSDEEEEEEEEEGTDPLTLRSNFDPLANFTASVETNEEGIAKIDVSIPDNITRYRVWAVSVTEDAQLYGLGDSLITARLPLLLRCSPPRFLNYKDSCEMPVVIQNLTEKPLNAKVVIRARNATFGNGVTQMGFKIEVPSN